MKIKTWGFIAIVSLAGSPAFAQGGLTRTFDDVAATPAQRAASNAAQASSNATMNRISNGAVRVDLTPDTTRQLVNVPPPPPLPMSDRVLNRFDRNQPRPLAPPASAPVGRRSTFQGVGPSTNIDGAKGSRQLELLEENTKLNYSEAINSRLYTGHALDRMQGRGLVPSVVEDAISKGDRKMLGNGVSEYQSATNKVAAIVSDNTGKVITTK